VDPTANAIRAAGLTRVALLGTKPVMSTDFLKRRYQEKFDIEIVVPGEEEQNTVDGIIFDELCRGVFTALSKATCLALIDKLQARGAEGVILGCTEIPLLIAQQDRPEVPFFITLELHVGSVVRLALAD
jgi:aspartate racemase